MTQPRSHVEPVAECSTSLTLCSIISKMGGLDHGLTIEWSTKAMSDTRRLARRDKEGNIAKIAQYARDPTSLADQAITLTGGKYRRLRAGNHRVIFNLESSETASKIVLRIRRRREAYD